MEKKKEWLEARRNRDRLCTPPWRSPNKTDREKIQALILGGIRNRIWSGSTLEDLFNEVDLMMDLITIKSED